MSVLLRLIGCRRWFFQTKERITKNSCFGYLDIDEDEQFGMTSVFFKRLNERKNRMIFGPHCYDVVGALV